MFVKLWSQPEILDLQETRRAYLYSMVRNQIFNVLKHRDIVMAYEEQQSEKPDYLEADAEHQLYAKEIQLLYKLALEQMPQRRREIFLMSRHQRLSNQEIADRLGLSVRTVEHHLYLALQQIKKIIVLFLLLVI